MTSELRMEDIDNVTMLIMALYTDLNFPVNRKEIMDYMVENYPVEENYIQSLRESVKRLFSVSAYMNMNDISIMTFGDDDD